jgi:chromate transporter
MLPTPAPSAPAPVSLAEAFLYWLRLGFISFGGPAGQIAVMHQDLVERRRWISERRFLHGLNYCMLLPGPEAIQLAIYIGWLMHRVRGGIMAGVLFFLPSFLLLVLLSWIYLAYGSVPAIAGLLYGIKPAVVAIVAFAAWRIGSRTLRNNALRSIAAAAFVAIFVFDVPFPAIVLAAAILGALGGRIAPRHFSLGGHGPNTTTSHAYGAALIDDDTPTPAHARFTGRRMTMFATAGFALWAISLALLAIVAGAGTLMDMGWFFSKAALLTFGGAYAVLPYVYQGGVEHFAWLTGSQMIDGLALGETTPGPLIMVVTFIGFVGAWTRQILGPDALFAAGVAGAAVATWFTLLPSFVFILVGGPLVEATLGELRYTAPLTGITAAVVGVIVNLAVFFAWHVLWPTGTAAAPFAGRFEWVAALLAVAAFVALFRFKVGIIPVVGAGALAGLVASFLN